MNRHSAEPLSSVLIVPVSFEPQLLFQHDAL